jgi:U3 small nucleolar RNA-associated protein 3
LLLHAVAQQARFLEQKLKLQQGEEDGEKEGAEDEGQQQRGERLWGANKRAYYQVDEAEEGSDDEGGLLEAEVRRLQAQAAAGVADDDYGIADVAGSAAAAAAAAGGERSLAQEVEAAAGGGVQVEAVARDLGGLTHGACARCEARASASSNTSSAVP